MLSGCCRVPLRVRKAGALCERRSALWVSRISCRAGPPRDETTASEGHDPRLFETAHGDGRRPTQAAAYDERLFDPGPRATHAGAGSRQRAAAQTAGWERVGGVRVERAEPPPVGAEPELAASRALEVACRPTHRPFPSERDLTPATEAARDAVREAAAFEAINRLGDWLVAGDEARHEAARAARAAQEQANAEADASGLEDEQRRRVAERRARRAAADVLERHLGAAWRTPPTELELGEPDTHTLEIIARLRFAAPRLLGGLLAEPPSERVLRERLARLHDVERAGSSRSITSSTGSGSLLAGESSWRAGRASVRSTG